MAGTASGKGNCGDCQGGDYGTSGFSGHAPLDAGIAFPVPGLRVFPVLRLYAFMP
jgi:hypothetical protein